MSLIQKLSEAISWIRSYVPMTYPAAGPEPGWKIVIECTNPQTAQEVRMLLLRELSREINGSVKPLSPDKPVSIEELEITGVKVEIRSRIT